MSSRHFQPFYFRNFRFTLPTNDQEYLQGIRQLAAKLQIENMFLADFSACQTISSVFFSFERCKGQVPSDSNLILKSDEFMTIQRTLKVILTSVDCRNVKSLLLGDLPLFHSRVFSKSNSIRLIYFWISRSLQAFCCRVQWRPTLTIFVHLWMMHAKSLQNVLAIGQMSPN